MKERAAGERLNEDLGARGGAPPHNNHFFSIFISKNFLKSHSLHHIIYGGFMKNMKGSFDILISDFDVDFFKVDFLGRFNETMLDAVRSVPGRRWNNDAKLWLIPDTKAAANELLRNIFVTGLFNYSSADNTKQNQKDKLIPYRESLKKMEDLLTVRHYSPRTVNCYLKWVEEFLEKYGGIGLEKLSQKQINDFLSYLAVNYHVSPSTQNQALAGLLFYFRYIKGENPLELDSVRRAKKTPRIPVVFSRAEVKRVIEFIPVDKRLCAEMLYGTGMRLNELIELRIQDIDFDGNEITIRHGKGDKDRLVMLP